MGIHMPKKIYFYEYTLKNGEHVRRETTSKRLAETIYRALLTEALFLNVESVSFGLVN